MIGNRVIGRSGHRRSGDRAIGSIGDRAIGSSAIGRLGAFAFSGRRAWSDLIRALVDRRGRFQAVSARSIDCLAAAAMEPPADWRAPNYLESIAPFAVPARANLDETRTLDLALRP